MPRPRIRRMVRGNPVANFYKPHGVPLHDLKGMVLSVEGLEALRLADAEGLDQGAAAESMGVSRPTFNRVLAEARATVAQALVNGWAIRIEGGDYEVAEQDFGRPGAGGGRGRGGRVRGGGGGRGRGRS